jgi:hypothetical protein
MDGFWIGAHFPIIAVSNAHIILASEFNPKKQPVIQSAFDCQVRHD